MIEMPFEVAFALGLVMVIGSSFSLGMVVGYWLRKVGL